MGRKKSIFSGCATALITPFKNGEIDFASMENLIEFQINNGADAIVLLGTTGEASTVSEDERGECISFAKSVIRSRLPLIVGTGTNNTKTSIRYSENAEKLGANAILAVTPYYNKASDKGLILHYQSIANSVGLPIILYNVPSRTGVNISMKVYDELAKADNIVAIKEASGNLSYVSEILTHHSADFDVYSGNDDMTLAILSLGGKGVISVASNIVPSFMHQLCFEFFGSNAAKSAEIQLYLNDLIKEMFAEVNPIPIKTALYHMGMCENEFRLPMCQSTREDKIYEILHRYNLA